MFPKVPQQRVRSQSAPLPNSGLKPLGKSPNPLKLGMDDSPKMGPLPSPKKENQHIGQLVPLQQVQLENPKVVNPKRIQLVQLQIKTDDTDIKNSVQNLKAKVKNVFDAFALVHKENLVDNRKGTVPVYTLPEFFWSDFNSTLTKDEQNILIQEIKTRAQGDEFEGAVFVLGTMVSSEAPQSLTSLFPQDLQKIQQQLGDLSQLTTKDDIDFEETYVQAMDHGIEDCSTDQHEARALLATIGDMMEARLKKQDIDPNTPLDGFDDLEFDRDQAMDKVLKRVHTMSTHREALTMVSTIKTYPSSQTLTKFLNEVDKNDFKNAKKTIAKFFDPGVPKYGMNEVRMQCLAELFKAVGAKTKNLKAVAKDFRTFYFPKSASNQERGKFEKRVKLMKSTPKKLGSPSSMYKLTENKSMVIEGGKGGKVGFSKKLLPSHADSPSYFENRESDKLIPQKLQSSSIIANPKQDSHDLGGQIQKHHIDDSNFIFKSPKTGIDLGVTICRDYSDGVYKDHFDGTVKNQIDHLQIVSAGVPKIVENKGSGKTSVGLNDGLSGNSQFVTTDDLPHKGGQDIRTDIVEYNPDTKEFTYLPQGMGFEKQGMNLEDKHFSMGISKPTHLKDHNLSSLGSFKDDTNVGSVKLMEKMIQDHETSISLWQDMVAELEPILTAITKDVIEIDEITMKLTRDNDAKLEFEKKNEGQKYVSPLNHEDLQSQLEVLHDKVAPWIDQVNQDVLLLSKNGDQPFDRTEGSKVRSLLRERVETFKANISGSTKIVNYNKESLNRITIDRLKSQQQLV